MLTQITRLDLSKNQIKFLPDDFGALINLRHLDLYSNKLEHLPLSFGHLKKLKYLDLKGNPLTSELVKVVGPCLTNKDCVDSAKRTVIFLADMYIKSQVVKTYKAAEEEKAKAQELFVKRESEKAAKLLKEQKRVEQKNNDSKKSSVETNNKNAPEGPKKIKKKYLKLQQEKERASSSITFILFYIALMLSALTFITHKYYPEYIMKFLEIIPEQQRNIIIVLITQTKDYIVDFYDKFTAKP